MMLKYGLPLDLAQCYFKHKSFFHNLKTLRDNIVHNGSRLDVIYKEDTKGFFVSKQFKPFDKYPIWLSDEVKPNELVPLIPALEYFIYKILAAFDSFSIILGRVIKWPAKVTKDMYLFMRGDHTYCLNESIQSTTCRIKKQDIIIDMAISNYLKKSKPNLHYNNPRLI